MIRRYMTLCRGGFTHSGLPLRTVTLSQRCPTFLYIGWHLTDVCVGAGAVWRLQ
jgi:hypothetical protein